MDLALRDRVALVTGASRGIGLAIAHSLLQEGVKLGICARGEEGLTEAARELRAAGGEVFAQVCDVREREAVDAFVQGAAEALGGIDIVVNNVGGSAGAGSWIAVMANGKRRSSSICFTPCELRAQRCPICVQAAAGRSLS